MQHDLQDLSAQEAAAVNGGDGMLMYYIGWGTGWLGHAITDAFLTPSPDGDFSWARDK